MTMLRHTYAVAMATSQNSHFLYNHNAARKYKENLIIVYRRGSKISKTENSP